MLKSGGRVFALDTRHLGADVAAKDLPQRISLFTARIELGSAHTLKIRLLHSLHQVAHKLVRVLLPPVHHVLADHLQSAVNVQGLHHIDVLVAGRLERLGHEANEASLAAILTRLARFAASKPIGK